MPTLVQINTVVNYTSTGRIAEGIGKEALAAGWRSVIAFGRHRRSSVSETIDLCDPLGTAAHVLYTRVADRHGLHSRRATVRLIRELERVSPDVIHLHNIHGYYLDYRQLFRYLRETRRFVVWTLHDCWPFTGHCCYFDAADCHRWVTGCGQCPLLHTYPTSLFVDRSAANWAEKRELFTGLSHMQIVTPSHWLATQVAASYLRHHPCETIHNGVDLEVFRPRTNECCGSQLAFERQHLVLAVASDWGPRKGLDQVVALRQLLPRETFDIAVVGVTKKQAVGLPAGIAAILRTESVDQLASLYSRATVFVNPTLADNFPTTNVEALACGTPVVTYETGGSPEAIDAGTGAVVGKGDVSGAAREILRLAALDRDAIRLRCRDRAVKHFCRETQFRRYVTLYECLLANMGAPCA